MQLKMKDKKVALFMLPLLTDGAGAEKYFIDTARNFSQKGIKVDIITMDENFFRRFAKLLYFFVYHKWYSNIDISGRESQQSIEEKLGGASWIKASWKDLGNILKQYDIIYSKNELVDLMILKIKNYKKLPPIIVGVHTPLYYPVTKSFLAKLHNYLYSSFFYRFLLNGTACIHLSNKFQKKLSQKRYKLKNKLIYYPFSTKEINENANKMFYEKEFSPKFNIVFVGRLSEQKGIKSLANIINKISLNKKISDKLVINIFGSGSEMEENIIKEAEKKHDFVRYYGHVENKFIPNILSRQDLFITTARWETLPFNVLEAQAMGLPVIAFDIPGPNDIIENEATGFLVKDEEEFLDKIIVSISNRNKFSKSEIIRNVENKFDPNKIYSELLLMFEENMSVKNTEKIEKRAPQKLNFGCGRDIKRGYLNADITPFDGTDLIFDFNKFPYPFPDDNFEEIYCDNVLEHVDDISMVMSELHRISRKGGIIRIIVPYYNCYGAYNDVTHRHYFSHLSFEPFYIEETRGNYFIKQKFQLGKITLVPTRLGRLIPFDVLRKHLSFIFGQIIQTIDVVLIVKKEDGKI